MQRTIPLILTSVLLLTGCENNDRQAAAQPARQQEPAQIYSEDQQQTPAESEEPAQKIRTITKFYNGQEYVAYDINPPLMHLPLAEIQKRAEADDPAAISELGRRYSGKNNREIGEFFGVGPSGITEASRRFQERIDGTSKPAGVIHGIRGKFKI